mgnify:CR=1 FL=1
MKLNISIIIFILCGIAVGFSQDSGNNAQIAGTTIYLGHITSGNNTVYLNSRRLTGYSADFTFFKYDNKSWRHFYNFPETGIKFYYSNLSGNDFLGKTCGLYPYLLFTAGNQWKIRPYLQAGLGIAYLSKKFHPEDNYYNQYIGSNLNVLIDLSSGCRYRLFNRMMVFHGFSFMHLSNGEMAQPNTGINTVSWNSGIHYIIAGAAERQIQRTAVRDTVVQPYFINVSAGFGIKECNPKDQKKYANYRISAAFLRRLNAGQSLGLGLDVFYESADIILLENQDKAIENTLPLLKPGIALMHINHFGRFSVIIQAGVHFYRVEKSQGPFYERLGCSYTFYDPCDVYILYKAYDNIKGAFIEWGFTWKL